jgi:hypothetical protein
MLLDKSYYDYDYTAEKPRKPTSYEFMSDEEVASLLGSAVIPGTNELVFKPNESADDLQKIAMEDSKNER